MKTTMITAIAILIMAMGHAQDKNKSVSFEVKGNCGMCKSRIEKASIKLKGVKFATWSPETKLFEAVIDERKITMTNPHPSSETYRVCVMYEACPCFVFPTHAVEPELSEVSTCPRVDRDSLVIEVWEGTSSSWVSTNSTQMRTTQKPHAEEPPPPLSLFNIVSPSSVFYRSF